VEILKLDFTRGDNHPKTFTELVDSVARRSDEGTGYRSDGLFSPWNYVVMDSIDGVAGRLDFYESFLGSVNLPRMILLIDASSNEFLKSVSLPILFEHHQERMRIILITSLSGSFWDGRSHQPDGISVNNDGATAKSNLDALVSALVVPEVFEALFYRTSESPSQLWSVGTRQAWFGSIAPRSLADAFKDVGEELLGDSSRIGYLRRLDPWVEELNHDLFGGEFEDDILEAPGIANSWFDENDHSAKHAITALGLERLRRGVLARLASFPTTQVQALEKVSESLRKCDSEIGSLLEHVDPSDGFQSSEQSTLRKKGIQLNRRDGVRDKYRGADTRILEMALAKMDEALQRGYSIETVRAEIKEVLHLVQPRTPAEILNGKEHSSPLSDLIENLKGYQDVSLGGLAESVKVASQKIPRNPSLYIARWTARRLQSMTFRVISAFMSLWLFLIVLFETFELSPDIPSLLPVPESLRDASRLVVTITFFALMGVVALSGLNIWYASRRIHRWGKESGITKVSQRSKACRRFLENVALNDWVLWSFRTQASRYLSALDTSLENLGGVIRRTLIRADLVFEVGSENHPPNPQVQQIGGDLARSAWFRQMDDIKEMMKAEVISLVRHHYEVGTPEFRTDRCFEIAESLAGQIEAPLVSYVRRLEQVGVLHLNQGMTDAEIDRRKKLALNYWGDFDELESALVGVVRSERSDPIVQFLRPDDIMRVDQSPERGVLIRFAPEPSRRLVSDLKQDGPEIVFTQGTELAGVVRLIPYRLELLSYKSKVS
jgi:hypothetical protein